MFVCDVPDPYYSCLFVCGVRPHSCPAGGAPPQRGGGGDATGEASPQAMSRRHCRMLPRGNAPFAGFRGRAKRSWSRVSALHSPTPTPYSNSNSTLQLQLHTPTQIPPSNSNSILQLQALWLTFVCFRVPRRRFSCLAGMQARRAEPATWRRARRSLKPGSKATVQIALARLHPRQVRGRAPAHSTLQLQLHTPTPSIMADFRELARPRKDTKRGLDV